MNTMLEIERAVCGLSPRERRRLLDWLAQALDSESGVSEPVAKYGNTAEEREFLSLKQYFEMEQDGWRMHEYVAGEIYDIAGPSQAHEIISMNIAGSLYGHLRDRPCRIYSGRRELQFKCQGDDYVYRPDVWVACGETRDAKGLYVDEPLLVVEVLSPSTARIDRREKVQTYREVPSIEEYVLVTQRPASVVTYRRAQQWRPQALDSTADVLDLRSVGLALPVSRIYKGVAAETRPQGASQGDGGP
jgi:Uma2 family endonuclease